MPPFDGAHATSYSSLIESMRLRCTVFDELFVEIRPSTYPTCIWCPRWGHPSRISTKIFGIRELEFLSYHAAFLPDPTFSHCSRTPTCDGHTGRQTQGYGMYCAQHSSRGKNVTLSASSSPITWAFTVLHNFISFSENGGYGVRLGRQS